MHDDLGSPPPAGVSRRELLRRGAALGAAVTVATPLVQSMGRMAAFAQTSPPPSGGASYPSHFQILFTVGSSSTVYGIKYEEPSWGDIGRGASCWPTGDYRSAGDHRELFTGTVTKGTADGKGAYVFTPPASVTIVDARAFDGQYSGGESGKCSPPVAPQGGVFHFTKP